MRTLLDFSWRLGLRLIYPLARLYWRLLKPDVQGTYVFVWCGNRILLTRNSYRRGLIAPGGMVRAGEEPIETAIRELTEETGVEIRAEQLRHLGKAPKRDPAGFGTADMFEAQLEEEPRVTIDNREVVWAGFLTCEDALEEELDYATKVHLEGRASSE